MNCLSMQKSAKRILAFVLAVSVVTMLSAVSVWAASPHFIKATATKIVKTGDVKVAFIEAGLGQNTPIDYTASATSTSNWVCVDASGTCQGPSIEGQGRSNSQVTIESGPDGKVSATLTLSPAPPSKVSICAGGHYALADVTWSGIEITDNTNGIFEPTKPDSFQKLTLFPCGH